MNASGAAPAPVVALGAAKGGKNRKVPGTGTPAALGRGLSKGSVRFQEILSARAAEKSKGAALAMTAAHAASQARAQAQAQEAAGLKGLLSALVVRAHAAADAEAVSEKAAAHAKEAKAQASARNDASRKGQPDHQVALLHPGLHVHGEVPSRAVSAAKEPKEAANEQAKAAAVDAKPVAHRPEPLIRIVDLRRHQSESADSTAARKTDPAPSQDRDPTVPVMSRPASREMPVEGAARPAALSTPAQTPLERLHEMAGSELVRASHLVLKDGGGEIRLVLKPESLGSVRVRMNVVDNSIEGRIIVDSAAVKHVLDGSVDALRRALTAEGFQMGSLQVSVGGQEAQSDPRREQEQAPAEVRRIAAQGFERSVPGAQDMSLGDLFVNLFV